VLSQDIFTVPVHDLPKTVSVLAMVGGKVVYDAKILPLPPSVASQFSRKKQIKLLSR